jgi:predicted amidohydrolase YtcJ
MALGIDAFLAYGSDTLFDPMKGQLQLTGVKIILDETTGDLYPPQSLLNDWVRAIHQSGLQAIIHCIETNAVEAACDAIEQALNCMPRPDHRHRIEHCSICPAPLAKRIAELCIRVVTQPAFIYDSGDRYLGSVGKEDLQNLYPFQRLINKGVHLAGGSDAPVARLDPLTAISTAVTRKAKSGKRVSAEQAIDITEALTMYTNRAAEALGAEEKSGSITPGKHADLVVLNKNLLDCGPDEISLMRVILAVADGKVVWQNEANKPT